MHANVLPPPARFNFARHLIDLNAEWRLLIYGLILILTILLMPQGIVGSLRRLRKHA